MLTPQEVGEKAFQKASFGGYNMAQVDEFLDVLTADYGALYTENAVLKSKMKVLADSVEEYRSTEKAMRKALSSAQQMADDMIANAEAEKASILAEAESLARERVATVRLEREAEEARLAEVQRQVIEMTAQVREIFTRGTNLMENMDDICPVVAPAEVSPEEAVVNDIDESVQRILEQAIADVAMEEDEEELEPWENRDATIALPDLSAVACDEDDGFDDELDLDKLGLGEEYRI